ncbi:MAG TPA: OmpA family protein [Geomonas sp.]
MGPAQKKTGGRVLARWLALLLLLVPGTAAPLTPAGSVITHSFVASFGALTPPQGIGSNQTQVMVRDLADPTIVPARSAATLAGQPVDFPHTISNRGNSSDSFLLKAALKPGTLTESGAAPAMQFFASDGRTPLAAGAGGSQVAGPLPPGASLDLVLRVTPPPGSEGRVYAIEVSAASTLAPARGSSLSNQLVVLAPVAPSLRVSKQAGSAVAEAGDIVSYTVQVENTGTAPLAHATVSDLLPRGFRYLKGSTLLDGRSSPDPAGTGQRLSWDLGTLDPGQLRALGYRLAVSADAPVGSSVNWASGSGVTPGGGASVSPQASATVRVRPSILGDKAIILGRLFEDLNANGMPDPGEPGVPGVRIYLEDGSFTVSDPEGQYSFTGISAGNHVVKIDRSTLARRLRPAPYNTAFAGVGWSQFITVPFGGPARGDFALVPSGLAEEAPPASEAAAPQPISPEGTVPGPAVRLTVTPERVDMPADGKSVLPVTVELLNAQGRRVAGERTVTVSLGRGAIVEPDADPALPGHQIRVQDGIGVFRVRSGISAGQDVVRVSGENGSSGGLDLYFSSELRDWIVVGLGSLTFGGKAVSGHLEKIDKEDRFDEGIFHEERLAFFTRGKILGKYLLTAAYDSGKERRDGVFQAIDPEKYYPVYGDASDLGYEAQSRGKVYLKLEAGRSYLLGGDYRTDLSENEFTRYDRALNGVKFELNGEHASARGFESRTEETAAKDEIPGNGSSGYFFLSRKPVFENSERVRIEVRDRYHSERVLSVVEKLRYADYSIDYSAGTVLFKEPVPSLDQNLNPVTIVVVYQSQSGGAKRYVYGGRGLLKGDNGSFFGGTAVVEEGALKDSTLFGLDAGVKFGERVTLKGEGAVSDTLDHGRGSARKAEFSARPLDSLNLGAYYRKVDADFFNSSMTGTETGTEKYGGRLDYRGLPDTLLSAESFVQKDALQGGTLFGNQAGFVRKFSLLEGEGGFKRVAQEKGGAEGHSDLLYAGVKGALSTRLDATLRRDQLLAPSSVAEYQTRTFLKLDYRITDATRAFVTEEYQEGDPLVRQATLLGVESRLSERMRLTTGYQLSSGSAGSTQHSNVDLNTKLVERQGFSLNSRSGYQLENALSGERGQAILGLNSRLEAAPGVLLNSTLERVQTVQGSSGTRTAFTLAGEYLRQRDLKLTGRYEIRSGPDETASLYGAGLAYKVNGSLTLLGKGTVWDRDADAGHDLLLDGYLGTAFRPLAGHPLQLLTLVRYKQDDKGSVPGADRSKNVILSAEPTYRVDRNWSAQGKYAGKRGWLTDPAGNRYRAYTDLILAGLSYDLAERWELACYLKLTNQYDTRQHSFGAVASAGYRVYRNVVLGAGYNYARLDDRDLTGESFQGQGPFLGVKVKFDEEMFDSTERRVLVLPEPAPVPQAVAEAPPELAPVAPQKAPKPPVPALLFAAAKRDEPLQLSGSAELFTLLINGEQARLPSTKVTVSRERLSGSLQLKRGRLARPLTFLTSVEKPELVRGWSLSIMNAAGEPVRVLKGAGAPGARLAWDGETDGAGLVAGELYQYQLEVSYRDGSLFSTGRELFGVSRQDVVFLTLSGGAFVFDSARLTGEAKRLLKGAAGVLRAHPEDKVIVEGHTDGIGTVRYNMGLSRRRCDAAADFLVREEAIPPERLLRRWYGKSLPVADNRTADGRRLNRRVELKADFRETVPVGPNDRYRSAPFVVINDLPVPVDPLGRFETFVPADSGLLRVKMGDSLGRSLATAIAVPELKLAEPAGRLLVRYGSAAGGVRVDPSGAAHCRISGETAPGNTLEVDGERVQLGRDGRFALELPLKGGEQVVGMVLRGEGCLKLMNLRVESSAQEAAPGTPPAGAKPW